MDGSTSHARELARLEARLAQRLSEASQLLGETGAVLASARRQLDQRESERRTSAGEQARRAADAAGSKRQRQESAARTSLEASLNAWPHASATAAWSSSAWGGDGTPELPSSAVRIGELELADLGPVPAMVPSIGEGHVQLVGASPDLSRQVADVAAGIVLRVLASAPAGRIRFRVHDPAGLGATLGELSQFDPERVRRGTPTTSLVELERALDAVTQHATEVSTSYLRGVHSSLTSYLVDDPHADVGFELVVLLDVDRQADERLFERIGVLADSGAARGIMLVTTQTSEIASLRFGPASTRVDVLPSRRARVSDLPGHAVTLDGRAPAPLVERIAKRAPTRRRTLAFADLHPIPEARSSAGEISVPVGRAGRDPVEVALGDDPVNGLIAGTTGSGKSNLLRTLIYGLARRYPPSELELHLLDFKEGAEFLEFAPTKVDRTFLPHAAVVSINSSREFGLEVLRHLNRVAASRYALFGRYGVAPQLSELRAKHPELPLPRILLVVDEFQRLFDVNDELADAAAAELVNIAKQGRAAGVHFILATQSIGDVGTGTSAGSHLDGVFKNATLRIGMRLSEGESRQLFSSVENTAAATIHERGVAIVNRSGGAEAFNVRTVVARLEDADAAGERRKALAASDLGRVPPRIYDGGHGADPMSARPLRSAIRQSDGTLRTWPAQYLDLNQDDARLREPLRVAFEREPRRHMAVVGAGARSAASLLQWAAIGLAASRPGLRLRVVDLLRREDVAEGAVPQALVDATCAVADRLGAEVEVIRTDEASALVDALEPDGRGRPVAVVPFGSIERVRGLARDHEDGGFRTTGDVLRERLAEAGNEDVHLLAGFTSAAGFMALDGDGSFGARFYLRLDERSLLQVAQTAQRTDAPLALWHDVLGAREPRPVHCFEPFGAADVPGWCARP